MRAQHDVCHTSRRTRTATGWVVLIVTPSAGLRRSSGGVPVPRYIAMCLGKSSLNSPKEVHDASSIRGLRACRRARHMQQFSRAEYLGPARTCRNTQLSPAWSLEVRGCELQNRRAFKIHVVVVHACSQGPSTTPAMKMERHGCRHACLGRLTRRAPFRTMCAQCADMGQRTSATLSASPLPLISDRAMLGSWSVHSVACLGMYLVAMRAHSQCTH